MLTVTVANQGKHRLDMEDRVSQSVCVVLRALLLSLPRNAGLDRVVDGRLIGTLERGVHIGTCDIG